MKKDQTAITHARARDGQKRRRSTRVDETQRILRVDAIAEQMRSLTFQRGKTCRALAVEWGLHVDTVKRMAAEASRLVALEFDRDAALATVNIRLEKILREGEDRDAVRAADIVAKLAGIYQAQKLEMGVSVERLQFEALPPAEQAKRLREKAKECIEAAERIEKEVELGLPAGTIEAVAVAAASGRLS